MSVDSYVGNFYLLVKGMSVDSYVGNFYLGDFYLSC